MSLHQMRTRYIVHTYTPGLGPCFPIPFVAERCRLERDANGDPWLAGTEGVPDFSTREQAVQWLGVYCSKHNAAGLYLHIRAVETLYVPERRKPGLCAGRT